MVDIIKQDMTDIWAVAGDVVAPDSAKVRAGWGVEAVPRQWWNWFENRQDSNIAYMLQKGIPEWDQFTEYLTNKSYVQRNNIVYKCILTGVNKDPATTPANWVKAFPESSAGLEALKAYVPVANTFPYMNGSNAAAAAPLTPFARSILDDVDDAAVRATINAQQSDATLTALAGLATTTNKLPYFSGVDVASLTDLTAFARSILDDGDAATVRATIGVDSATDVSAALAAGLATKQPLNTNLTNLAGLTITPNTIPYYNGASTLGLTAVTTYGRGFVNLTDALASRTYIGADDASNLTTGTIPLARIPLNLTGVNAATATKLATARTIQGVPFDGSSDITLSVVDKDSAVGSAALPAGTSAQRTASPSNGMLRYNNETNEFEGFQNGAWAGIGGGTPLYTVLWWPNRASIPAGYIPADGQLLSRTSYQAAFAGVNSGILPVVSDSTWLATSTSRGCYTTGNGTTTFRIPDLNGTQAGTLAAPFLRGDGINSAGVAGQFQGSANLAHTHTATNNSTFVNYPGSGGTATLGAGSAANTNPTTASSGGVESRPVNVTGVFVIKLIGGASELSQDDASVAVAALEDKVAYVSGRNRIINGDCRVQQRPSATFTQGTGGYGGPDRYNAVNVGVAGGSFTQSSGTIVEGGVTRPAVVQTVVTPISTSLAGNFWTGIAQNIEGVNCFDMVGKPISVSFLFRTNVTGNYTVALGENSNTFLYQFSAVANVPVRVAFTAPANLNLTISNNTSQGLVFQVGAINTGSFQSPTNNSWLTGQFKTVSGSTNWGATAGNFISMTQLQIEVGNSPTPFEVENITAQLAKCQRYYAVITTSIRWYAATVQTVQTVPLVWPVSMRALPSIVYTGSNATLNIFNFTTSAYSTTTGALNAINSATNDTYMLGAGFILNAEI